MTQRFSPGSRLTRARRKLKLTRADVAARLAVATSQVKYLDQWQLAKLPASRQRELVRAYALLVGLNPADFQPFLPPEEHAVPRARSIITLSRTSSSLLTLLALLSIAGFLAWRVFLAVAVPELTLQEPRQGQVLRQPLVSVSGHSTESAQVFVNGVNILKEPSGRFQTDVVLSVGANTISVVAVNRFGRQAESSRTVIYEHP